MRSLYPVLEHGHLLQRRNSTVVSMWSEREKAMHSNGAFPPDISWVDDANWFEEEVRRYIALAPALNVTRPATRYEKPQEWQIQGCCPAAVAMWPERHGHRCCSEKWHRLLPVRAVGGVNLDMLSSTTASGRTVVFLADSMGEQQLVALLCQAWISPGFKFEMLNCDGQPSFDSSNHLKDCDGAVKQSFASHVRDDHKEALNSAWS
ncbi:hypothetical protein AB1Y20_011378 [Prymnesium parvum]|uniref:Protein xylosyltransferase n=1 Tax=Prymnesium parvum TaxID=97485 RepID=A0AB34ILN8_PRYPA